MNDYTAPPLLPRYGRLLAAFFILAIIAYLIVYGVECFVSYAFAHSQYPILCCNGTDVGGDCHPVACDSIAETKDGYVWRGFKFTGDMVHVSFDTGCHACVSEYTINGHIESHPHCIFIQPTS